MNDESRISPSCPPPQDPFPGEKTPVSDAPVSEGHRGRLREKFLKAGLAGFLDYEVIELLLTLGTPRRDCREPARLALREFRTLRGV
jgi:DNA repair protein RadC